MFSSQFPHFYTNPAYWKKINIKACEKIKIVMNVSIINSLGKKLVWTDRAGFLNEIIIKDKQDNLEKIMPHFNT